MNDWDNVIQIESSFVRLRSKNDFTLGWRGCKKDTEENMSSAFVCLSRYFAGDYRR